MHNDKYSEIIPFVETGTKIGTEKYGFITKHQNPDWDAPRYERALRQRGIKAVVDGNSVVILNKNRVPFAPT